jgi:hypothetical protein
MHLLAQTSLANKAYFKYSFLKRRLTMRLNRQTDYAFRVLMLAGLARKGELTTIKQVSDAYDISEAHLMKVVRKLGQSGIIETSRSAPSCARWKRIWHSFSAWRREKARAGVGFKDRVVLWVFWVRHWTHFYQSWIAPAWPICCCPMRP